MAQNITVIAPIAIGRLNKHKSTYYIVFLVRIGLTFLSVASEITLLPILTGSDIHCLCFIMSKKRKRLHTELWIIIQNHKPL